ncbi:hypothetical protein UlMin_017376 [Ulmus minor]
MAGLQRSAVSFRRQGSSGLVWDDKLVSEELNKMSKEEQEQGQGTQQGEEDDQREKPGPEIKEVKARPISIDRSRSNGGGRGYRTGRVSPAIEPPSPKVSACGFCSAFGKPASKTRRTSKTGKRRSR